eukprot:1148598-Pelagomonas_calceolata.AAC.2
MLPQMLLTPKLVQAFSAVGFALKLSGKPAKHPSFRDFLALGSALAFSRRASVVLMAVAWVIMRDE